MLPSCACVGEEATLPKSMRTANNSGFAWSKKILTCYKNKEYYRPSAKNNNNKTDQHFMYVWGIKSSLSHCLCAWNAIPQDFHHSPMPGSSATFGRKSSLTTSELYTLHPLNTLHPSLGSSPARWCSCLPCFMPSLECLPLLPHLLYLHSPRHLARSTSTQLMLDDHLLN